MLTCAACIGGFENPAGNVEPDQWTVRISLENVGDGAGRVAVQPSAGTVANPCRDPLGPGQSCTVVVEHTGAIGSVLLNADPDEGSAFTGYAGACSGSEEDCTIRIPREGLVSVMVRVSFNRVAPG